MRVKLSDAISRKFGHVADVDNTNNTITAWRHESLLEPTKEEIAVLLKEQEDYCKSLEYKEKRESEYPSIEDQLDAIWKGGSDLEDMRNLINTIKQKYPKQ